MFKSFYLQNKELEDYSNLTFNKDLELFETCSMPRTMMLKF